MRNRKRLQLFYDRFVGGDHVLILMTADPDAMASAMAAKRLLWRKVSSIALAHTNVIRRPDNLAMIRLLGIDLQHVDDIHIEDYSRFVLLDSQPSHHEFFEGLTFDVIIDHHPDTAPAAGFKDIRPSYGATATLMTEYLRAARIKPSKKLATALFHGIKTDTRNFERQTQIEDVVAFQYLFRYANIPLARHIEKADLQMNFLKYFRRAIDDRRLRKGKMFVHLGAVHNPDICVLVAEFFMRIDTVQWSIVSGVCDKRLTVVFRNDGLRRNAGQVAHESFGAFGSAGGHRTMARGELPLATLPETVDTRDTRKFTNWLIQRVQKRADAR
ncbi:MAG: DHH family phosphoesterase [Desulfobacterales bacterium]|nr:DHH family phosphoesterase [Desulfobacterales bacterium]